VGLKHLAEYQDSDIARGLVARIKELSRRDVRLMEVCGTHTVAIFRSGIRTVIPETISLISGPGCPVCVTDQKDIDGFLEIAKQDDTIVATFGDLMRVPGTHSSLQKERGKGRDIRLVYSALDALKMAEENPAKRVVFLGVGFETTAPTVAAAILSAQQRNLHNFMVYSAFKRVLPALEALITSPEVAIDGFLLPGHVSVIIGVKGYLPFFEQHRVPCVVSGFEPVDILRALELLVSQVENSDPRLENAYQRAVRYEGNAKAQKIMEEVFESEDVAWRGLGTIPKSGFRLKERFKAHDAERMLSLEIPSSTSIRRCACGDILRGIKTPPECPLYKSTCTPLAPIGPCMVSSEGTCAAYFRYHRSC
jgi:hydrogenase expression/formation protein HypD